MFAYSCAVFTSPLAGRTFIPLRRTFFEMRKTRRHNFVTRSLSVNLDLHCFTAACEGKINHTESELITSCPNWLMEPYRFVIGNICGRWFIHEKMKRNLALPSARSSSPSTTSKISSISHALMRNHNFISIERSSIGEWTREVKLVDDDVSRSSRHYGNLALFILIRLMIHRVSQLSQIAGTFLGTVP